MCVAPAARRLFVPRVADRRQARYWCRVLASPGARDVSPSRSSGRRLPIFGHVFVRRARGRSQRFEAALFVAFGVMNLWAMIGLVAVVLGEKVLPRGEAFGRLAGAALLVVGALVLTSPSVADAVVPGRGLSPDGPMSQMTGGSGSLAR